MRAPPDPENQTAPLARRGGKVSKQDRRPSTIRGNPKREFAVRQDLVFTAIPVGRHWAVKTIGGPREVIRFGRFGSRLEALGAALLAAAQLGGRAIP